jgi:hypothetical protein
MLLPPKITSVQKKQLGRPLKRVTRILSETPSESSHTKELTDGANGDAPENKDAAMKERPDGVEPSNEEMMEIDTWEEVTGRELGEEDVDDVAEMVTWCLVSPLGVL